MQRTSATRIQHRKVEVYYRSHQPGVAWKEWNLSIPQANPTFRRLQTNLKSFRCNAQLEYSSLVR